MLAFWYNNEEVGAAFSYTIYGSLATAIDCLFRAIAMSYIFSVIKAYALLLPLGYGKIEQCVLSTLIFIQYHLCFNTTKKGQTIVPDGYNRNFTIYKKIR